MVAKNGWGQGTNTRHLQMQPAFGLPAKGNKRWCGGCAKWHKGAVNVDGKMCEGCQLMQPAVRLPAKGRARWCGGCAKGREGTANIKNKKCEGCGLKQPGFALPADGNQARWCALCAP